MSRTFLEYKESHKDFSPSELEAHFDNATSLAERAACVSVLKDQNKNYELSEARTTTLNSMTSHFFTSNDNRVLLAWNALAEGDQKPKNPHEFFESHQELLATCYNAEEPLTDEEILVHVQDSLLEDSEELEDYSDWTADELSIELQERGLPDNEDILQNRTALLSNDFGALTVPDIEDYLDDYGLEYLAADRKDDKILILVTHIING